MLSLQQPSTLQKESPGNLLLSSHHVVMKTADVPPEGSFILRQKFGLCADTVNTVSRQCVTKSFFDVWIEKEKRLQRRLARTRTTVGVHQLETLKNTDY